MKKKEQLLDAVRRHYESTDGLDERMAKVMEMVAALGDGPLTAAQLAPLDQFHARGLGGTKDLAEMAGIDGSMRVLDAGSGLGGPARYLAETFGCQVVGVDLTPSFVRLAEYLTARTGLSERVRYEVGDLAALPFADGEFDVVWTQHVVMNIPERARVYREFHRVLRPGGKLAFFDIYAPAEKPVLTYPVPWAQTAEESFLLTEVETVEALRDAGFVTGVWRDVTESGVAGGPAPSAAGLSLGTLIGPRIMELLQNLRENFQNGRLRLVMGSYSK